MAAAKSKNTKRDPEDLEQIMAEVASYASTLGLAAGTLTSSTAGFDDSDFRKSGPMKPHRPPIDGNATSVSRDGEDIEHHGRKDPKPARPKTKQMPHPLDIDPFRGSDATAANKELLPNVSLMKAGSLSWQWYVDAEELEVRVFGAEGGKRAPKIGAEELKRLAASKMEVAERLMEKYVQDYEASRRKNGDMRLLEATTRSGTSADKISAFACLVEDNPIANMRSLDALLSMVTSKVGKRYAFTGFEALRELFLLRLLPDRKLKYLWQHLLYNHPETKDGFSLLLFWHWEECLKLRYERFVSALEEALKDMLSSLKDKAMKTIYILLKSKPEQESRLLAALVNKLGDPDRKVASNAVFHLTNLLSEHPKMKAVVIEEVDSFIFRPHIGIRAKYNAIIFLCQFCLSKRDDGPKTAKRLIDVYFALFKVLISGNRDDVRTKNKKSRERSQERGKMRKKSNFIKGDNGHSTKSGFEMDSRLLSALLTGVNRAFPYVASDEVDDIVEVQTPILYKLVHCENFNVGVQALMLLYLISSKSQIASDRFYRALYSKLLAPAALISSKPEMFLKLLANAMKNDVNMKRIAAFSKRLLQISLQRPPQYACQCLLNLSEVLKAKPALWALALQNESVDDDVEHFEDIKEEPEDPLDISASGNSVNPVEVEHSMDHIQEQAATTKEDLLNPVIYNPRHREPSFCNAEKTSWWELTTLANHVHPSVATMARTLLAGANIVYGGDPLKDLSLAAFLDKFMEKKPKSNRKADGIWHGGSQIAPAKKLEMNKHLIGEELLELAEDDVPPEDVFFHRFYVNKSTSSKKGKKKKASVLDTAEEELLQGLSDNESEEEEIDKLLGPAGAPPLQDPGKDDYFDYDDLDGMADDDLIGDSSDDDMGPSNPGTDGRISDEDDDGSLDLGGGSDSSDDERADDDDDAVHSPEETVGNKRRRPKKKSGASPFASLDDYEHLMNDDRDSRKNPSASADRRGHGGKRSKSQSKSKRKKSA